MKGDGSHTSDSDSESASSYRTSDSESTSTCSYSSSSSSACKRKRKRRRRSSEHENENGRRSHSKKRSKNDHRNIELKKSGSSREDATKEKTKKCSRRRSATKSTCESSYSEDEERIYKKKRKAKEKRKKNKLKKKNKGEINQQKEACNLEVLHESVCIAGRRYEEHSALQAMANAKEQQKAIIQQQAELAKARLESGELQRARNEQMKMQDLYGTVDWRAKKKLRKEKRILERTVATGRKLASLDERETARMDAFRIAVGLPTAEAQRQAEWRAYATESLAELSEAQKSVKSTSRHSKVIGPSLPRS